MWPSFESPLHLIRHLSVLQSHTIRIGANGSEPANVRPLAMFLRLFATHDCTICLEDVDGSRRQLDVGARQAWFVLADGISQVQAAPGKTSGRLYVNEFG
ncbi:hypothetical protein ACERNI_01205 [Camelimonas sp. ID_303_24]